MVDDKFMASSWLIFFTVTLFVILLVQLFLLPFVFSSWHHGHGLLIGGDWIEFHEAALDMAENIRSEGWAAWELRPKGWMPSGVAAAIYVLSWPEPWALAPLNAAVHATTALLVMKLMLTFYKSRKAAFIASLPFAFFPSAMLWYTQIHRDGYNILGMMLFLYGLILIFKVNADVDFDKHYKKEFIGFFTLLSGVIIIWLVRPHALVIYQYMGLMLVALFTAYSLIQLVKKRIILKDFLIKVFLVTMVLVIITPLARGEGADKYLIEAESGNEIENESNRLDLVDPTITNEQNHLDEVYNWESTAWLPGVIENQLKSMAVLRAVTYQKRYGETASGIDYDVHLHSAVDYFKYFPRALQIALFAPFPFDWFQEGSRESTTFFRRISAFEMSFIYISYIFLLYGIWLWRKKVELYLVLVFCIAMIMPIVYSVPNVGTIYRYRYGFLMVLISLAVLSLIRLIIERKRHQKS